MSPFSRHTPYARLADFAEKRLTAAEQESLQAHLAECKHCSKQLALLHKMMHLMRWGKAAGASAEAFQWVTSLMQPRALAADAGGSAIRRMLAVLRSELAPFTPVFGERSAPSAAHQLFYEADLNALDLQITPHKEGFAVAGQLLGPCEPGEVELSGDDGSRHARFGESGEFDFPPVAAGNYKLLIRWSAVEIEVPELTLTM
jgi:hypothetical protein